MSYIEQKQYLEESITDNLSQLNLLLPKSPTINNLEQLQEEMENDYYTIVVVGEFKNGKSTFVNALLNEKLMPVDVIPTTATINAIFYGENRTLEIKKKNGDVESRELSVETLSEYTASADFNPDEINYLKIFMPSPLLKNKVVLVDTPGVNDLNEHRSEITHQFIPKADAILFMTNLRSPLTKSEEEFLRDIVSKEGINRIYFVANFLDRVDEEEMDDVVESLQEQIHSITGQNIASIFPISALQGLKGKLEGNDELLNYSGIKPLEEAIQHLLENGSKSQQKLDRYKYRMEKIKDTILEEIEVVQNLSTQSMQQLQEQQEGIMNWFNQKENWSEQMDDYIKERQEEIEMMAQKSLQYFGKRLKKDIANQVELFEGADIKPLMEKRLPITINNQVEQWMELYSGNLQVLFGKVEREVSFGLTQSFQQVVNVRKSVHSSLFFDTEMDSIEANTGNSTVKAGLVLGGASAIAVVLGATIIAPFIALAGMPYLQNRFAKKQMETIKPDLLLKIDEQITLLLQQLNEQVASYINTNITRIRTNTMEELEQQVLYIKQTIDEQVSDKSRATGELHQKIEQLTNFAERLNQPKEVLSHNE